MPFIGNQPAEKYSSFQKQDFTTSATTSYTLDHPVANGNEIALFINFVRQEPTAAYTASGTSLTLTSATTSSDDMYCVYLGKAVQTVNPPNSSVGSSQVSADLITGQTALGATPADTDELLISDAGTLKRVDFSHLKVDNTPAFFVSKTSDQSITDATATKATFDTEDFDTGSAFASSRFTVPSGEAGKYFFFSTLRCKASSGTMDYTLFRFYKNGTNDLTPFQLNAATNQLKNSHIAGSAIYDLSVGDYIEVYVTISGTSPSIGGDSARVDRSFFGGYKLIT
jgi:hypothetical protein